MLAGAIFEVGSTPQDKVFDYAFVTVDFTGSDTSNFSIEWQ